MRDTAADIPAFECPTSGRSLVVREPRRCHSDHGGGETHESRGSTPRALSGFLAQLIAVAQQVPQMRGRCRAAPADASACYEAATRGVAVNLTRGRFL
jgi:hypothetical protein